MVKILISEVTDLRSQVCIAGWCEESRRMVRPLSGMGGHHWPESDAGPHRFEPGNIVSFRDTPFSNNRGLPHAREDRIVAAPSAVEGRLSGTELARALCESVSNSIAELFQGKLHDERYVTAGSDCASLGAIEIGIRHMGFDDDGGKLRCWFYDRRGARYRLPVSARALRSSFSRAGIEALKPLAGGFSQAHIRIGLANPLSNGRCYAMVNNVIFY